MKVVYHPKDWRPTKQLDEDILTLFTLCHVVEPIDKLTLNVVDGTHILIEGEKCWACFLPDTNEIFLPANRSRGFILNKGEYSGFVLNNLAHEYVHAIYQRDSRKQSHRWMDKDIGKLYTKLVTEA